MSLFSGMKISGGKGEKSKDDSTSRKGQEDSTEKPVSAFGFIRDTPSKYLRKHALMDEGFNAMEHGYCLPI